MKNRFWLAFFAFCGIYAYYDETVLKKPRLTCDTRAVLAELAMKKRQIGTPKDAVRVTGFPQDGDKWMRHYVKRAYSVPIRQDDRDARAEVLRFVDVMFLECTARTKR